MEQIRSLNQNFVFKPFFDKPKSTPKNNSIYSTISDFKSSATSKSVIQKRIVSQTTLRKKGA